MSNETKMPVVTEEDLMKSLLAVEGKIATTPTEEVKPVVKTTELSKSAATTVTENATETLKKSLDASSALRDIVAGLGQHVDTSLAALQKSLQGSAERDMLFISVVGDMKKSIDAMALQIKEFGTQPATAPKSVTSTKEEVLSKGLKETGSEAGLTKENVATGLFELAKSLPPGSAESQRWVNAAVKYEATKEISDADLQRAIGAYKKLSA